MLYSNWKKLIRRKMAEAKKEKDVDYDMDKCKEWKHKKWHHHHDRGTGGWIYCLGVIGVAVYYIQQVNGFWPIVLAILKAIVWPAFLLYKVFTMLHM
jgi:hypothetical protein